MKPVDDKPVWSIICFFVDAKARHRGVGDALLKAAIAWAKKERVTLLEAYPCDKPARAADDTMWFGTKSMFDRAGFNEVAPAQADASGRAQGVARPLIFGGRSFLAGVARPCVLPRHPPLPSAMVPRDERTTASSPISAYAVRQSGFCALSIASASFDLRSIGAGAGITGAMPRYAETVARDLACALAGLPRGRDAASCSCSTFARGLKILVARIGCAEAQAWRLCARRFGPRRRRRHDCLAWRDCRR
jgi:hypothetical protein